MISNEQIKNNPQVLLAFTGLIQAEFEELLLSFIKASYEIEQERQAKQKRKRRPGGGRKAQLNTLADRLLFILFYLKPILFERYRPFCLV